MNIFKLKQITKNIILSLIGLWVFQSYGQQYNLGTIVPPSPNAASLGKFGGLNTNLSSGSINVDIPLYTFKSRKLSLPISLSYSSNGLKVDEIASRAGTGWNLNAGGVVSRTVFGSMDEYTAHARLTMADFESQTQRDQINYMNSVTGLSLGFSRAEPNIGEDSQPDLFNFNFNGLTGQLIIKYNHTDVSNNSHFDCVLLNHSGLKFETGLGNVAATGYYFKATTEDGVQYFFNAEESTVINDGLSSTNYVNIPSSFYLTKIVHPNNDTINLVYTYREFVYNTGKTQSIYHIDPNNIGSCADQSFPVFTDNTNTNTLTTSGWILTEINSTAGGKVKFSYIDRSDYNDKLLAAITIYQPGQTSLMKKDTLVYQYASNRPFLTGVTEENITNASNQTYKFNYYNLSQVPEQLAYSQDHWGYFNGKNNSTLIPVPTDPILQYYFPQANADREPDPTYSRVGVLSSIKYPTGGKDSIVYEGNTAYKYTTIYPAPSSGGITVTGDGTAWPGSTYSGEATIAYEQPVGFEANCDDNTIDPDDPVVYLRIIKVGTGAIYEKQFNYGESVSTNLLMEPGTYKFETTIYGNATVHASMAYAAGSPVSQYANVPVGGIRVAKMITYDPISNVSSIKKFNYSLFSNPATSSASSNVPIVYNESIFSYIVCHSPVNDPTCGTWLKQGYFTLHSNSLFALSPSNGNPVTYTNVTEELGNNSENGIIQHQFTSVPDADPTPISGLRVPGTPSTKFNLQDGKEVYTGIFKTTPAGFVPVKKTFINYKDDIRADSTIDGLSISRNYDFGCAYLMTGEPTPDEWASYNISDYNINRKWIYPDTIRTQTFNADGTSYAEEVKIAEYGNLYHALITKEQDLDSKGNMNVTTYTYPTDYSAAPYLAMVGLHIINPVIEKSSYKNTSFLYATRTNYANWGSTIYMPATIESKIGTGSYDTRIHYYNYDSYGNAICLSKENGPKISYLYSYGGQFPIAEIKNTDYATVETILGAGNIASFSNQFPDKAAEDSFLAPLFSGLPAAQITKIVYKPLVGITSMTDPKGQTTCFEYDNFQRLINIKDQYGNIIKHTDYHYYNQ